MQPRTLAASLCGAAVLLGAALWWHAPPSIRDGAVSSVQTDATARGYDTTVAASRDWARIGRESPFATGLESLPGSLQGTEVPDGLRTHADGSLQVTPGLRDVFDYFLSVIGEEDIDTVVARIRAYLDDQLPAGAAAEAQRILEDYLAFRDSLADLLMNTAQVQRADVDAIRQHQQAIRDRRQQFLAPAVNDAFFSAQDSWDDFGLSRLTVMTDDALTTQQKAAALSALRHNLPFDMQEDVDAVMRHQDLKALTLELAAAGGSEAELRQLREQVVGAEAADRLEALESERAHFQLRVSDWLDLRGRLLADSSLAPSDRTQQVEQLRTQYFSDDEQVRVITLEQLHDHQGSL